MSQCQYFITGGDDDRNALRLRRGRKTIGGERRELRKVAAVAHDGTGEREVSKERDDADYGAGGDVLGPHMLLLGLSDVLEIAPSFS